MTFSLKGIILVTIFLVHESMSHGYHRWGGWGPPRRKSYGRSHDSSYESQDERSSSVSGSNEEDSKCNPWIARTLNSLRAQVLYLERNIAENCKEDVLSTLCKSNYDYAAGRCYRLSREGLDWHKARFNCTMEGGDLIALETPLEEEALADYIVHKEGFKFQRFHTAGNDMEYKGLWHWGTGDEAVALTYENWAEHEPNDYRSNSEDCLEYRPLGGWNDIVCKEKRRFICELPPTYNPQKLKPKSTNKTVLYKNVIHYNIPAPPTESEETSRGDSSHSSSSSSSESKSSEKFRSPRDSGRQFKLKHKNSFYHHHGDKFHGHPNYGPHSHHPSHSHKSSKESSEGDVRRSRSWKYGGRLAPRFHGARRHSSSSEESRDESSESRESSHERDWSRHHPRHGSREDWHHRHHRPHHHHGPPPHHRHHYRPSPHEYFKHKYYGRFKMSGHHPWRKHRYDSSGSYEENSRERHMESEWRKRTGSKNKLFFVPVHVVKVSKTGINGSDANETNRHPSVSYETNMEQDSKNKTDNASDNAPQSEDHGIYVYSYVPPHRPQRIYYPALSPSHHPRIPYKRHKPHRLPSVYRLHYTTYNGEGKGNGENEGDDGGRSTSKGDDAVSTTMPSTTGSDNTGIGTGSGEDSTLWMNLTTPTPTTIDTSSPTPTTTPIASTDSSESS